MDRLGLDLQGADHGAVHADGDASATGLLHKEGHGVHLVEKAKLAVGALLISRVHEDASIDEGAVDIGDHRADIPCRVWLGELELDMLGELGDFRHPVLSITLVDGVDGLGLGRDLCVLGGKDELTDSRVEGEDVDTSTP